jgi:EmrB/QacA subfamily drug resistance transporter
MMSAGSTRRSSTIHQQLGAHIMNNTSTSVELRDPWRDASKPTVLATAARRHRGAALAVLCLAAFTINLDTTIVNIALPSLVRQLDASTRDLQWVVDAYNLTFAALVLAAGSLSDRYGRKGALLAGLAVFGTATAVGGLVDSAGALIAVRAVMGVGAAMIFPATLSLISNLYTERAERARAIGLWGAMTGLGVALGPITGGWLLEHFWWGSVFVAMAPVAAVAVLAAVVFVPTSRDPATPPVDVGGLALSTLAVGTLVFTIIEASERGWTAPATTVGFALAALAAAVFVAWERRRAHPMLDVSLFRNLRFSAASGSVMVIFFALAGFIFLITQYFQFLKGYSPLSTGVRILPVAICIAIGSVVGVRLSVTIGNKAIVATGLALVGISFTWVSTASTATPYIEIVGQMVLAGLGMGLTTAPATEAIMGVVPKEKAGIGSAVNDATRELGGTLGVAVIGSVYASLYASGIRDTASPVPAPALDAATESIGAAIDVSTQLGPPGQPLLEAAQVAFFDGFQIGCLVAATVLIAGAFFAARFLPSRPAPPAIAPPDRGRESEDLLAVAGVDRAA